VEPSAVQFVWNMLVSTSRKKKTKGPAEQQRL